MPEPVVTPTAGRCELEASSASLGLFGGLSASFLGVFQAGHQSHLELQTADLHPTFETPTHQPFPSGADSPSKLIPNSFSILDFLYLHPGFYHVHVHESRWTQPGPPHAFFVHLVQGKEVVGPEARIAQVASETREREGHVVDIAMVLVHTVLETF